MYGGKISYPCEYLASNIKNGKLFSIDSSLGEIEATKVIFAGGIDSNALVKKTVLKEPTPESSYAQNHLKK